MAVDLTRPRERGTRPPRPPAPPRFSRPSGWTLAVGGVLLVTFLLRIWGVKHGMPYAFNADENAHFVPKAIGLFGHGYNPHYFVNPPAYTYVLHIVFSVWFGGRDGVYEAYATDPASVFVVARVTAGVAGTLAVWLLYVAGTRLFDRRVGLLAAALFGVSFLPIFYSHLALNDVPTLAPICLALVGAAGVLRFGRVTDYLVAGAGLGFAAAFKYTGGIVILPLLGATAAQFLAAGGRRPALRGLALAGGAAFVAFVVANPYALLSFSEFKDGLTHQTTVADDAIGKLGLTEDNGFLYYLWTFTWGLGFVPAFAALGAVVALWRDERRLVWVLAPAPLLFLLFMGSQTRFFGRWLMPVFPMVCLLAAYAVLELSDGLGKRRPALRPTFVAIGVLALCGQGIVSSLHNGIVLSRPDTRNTTRAWMVANIPPKSKIVVEPVAPDAWASDIGGPVPGGAGNGSRWVKFSTSKENRLPDGSVVAGEGRILNVEDYERSLTPELIDIYEAQRFCWVIVGSTQRGRAEVEAGTVPKALEYYKELERRGQVVHRDSPYAKGKGPVRFNFDWSFDYYPLDYARPGPLMVVYRLHGGLCADVPG
ncbi:MAG: glycosyltransferase family 39 protein [Solirubrobacterales bacterium]|nr:glycosyltransferase family 39 protein [Solirubrobacterales bacterium]